MATTLVNGRLGTLAAHQASQTSVAPTVVRRRRQISPVNGRAIEMLGHAIEYLADEFALECTTRKESPGSPRRAPSMHPQIAAIVLLMEQNREIYLSCPQLPTLGERLRRWLHLRQA